MWYVIMFSGLAILCVVVVLIRNARVKAERSRAHHTDEAHHHSEEAHHHSEEDRARRERKRRRAQSKADRRKRH